MTVIFFLLFLSLDIQKTTVSTRIEPQSWIQPHPKKILIEPHPKTNIERIEPHLELNPTQVQYSEANLNYQNEH